MFGQSIFGETPVLAVPVLPAPPTPAQMAAAVAMIACGGATQNGCGCPPGSPTANAVIAAMKKLTPAELAQLKSQVGNVPAGAPQCAIDQVNAMFAAASGGGAVAPQPPAPAPKEGLSTVAMVGIGAVVLLGIYALTKKPSAHRAAY